MSFAAGIWLLVLGAMLCGIAYWWGALLIAVAAPLFLGGYLLLPGAQS